MDQASPTPAAVLRDAEAFLSAAFPGMAVRLPLIGQWPPGLRFVLGGPNGWLDDDPPRVRRIHERALAVFDACFPKGHDGFVLAQFEAPTGMLLDEPVSADDIRSGARVQVENARRIRGVLTPSLAELGPYVPESALSKAAIRVGANLHGTMSERYGPDVDIDPQADTEAIDDIPFMDVVIPVAPRDVAPGLVVATANREIRAEPKVGCQLFFVNRDAALILNIGDDRWLDVIASDPATLRPIAVRFIDWLLSAHLPESEASSP